MNSQLPAGARISIGDIAKLGGVGRPAVSNWRKRFPDFPQPVQGGTPTNPVFDLREVEIWLKRTDRWQGGSGDQQHLWKALDRLRELSVDEGFDAIAAFVTYRFLCEGPRSTHPGAAIVVVRPELRWDHIRGEAPSELLGRLQSAAAAIEDENQQLHGLIAPPLQVLNGLAAVDSLNLIGIYPVDQLPELFETLVAQRRRSTGRGGSEWTTAPDLVSLLVEMAHPLKGTVYDPASGAGDFLLQASRSANGAVTMIGQELNTTAWRLSSQRLILHGIDGAIFHGDTLNDDVQPQLKADVVLLDPPYGSRNLDLQRSGTDPRWRFGPPNPNNADTTWLQHAVAHLADDGRAFVLLPAGSMFRGGAEGRVRHELIRQGALQCVVALPPGLQTWTGIPLALWVLTKPGFAAQRERVLLIDASERGGKDNRSAAKRIARTYQIWLRDGVLKDQTHAAAPAVIDLLAVDATLIPAHWVSKPQDAAQRDEMLAQLESSASRLKRQVDVLLRLPAPSLAAIIAGESEPQRGSVGGFISDGRLTMIRGARIRRDELADTEVGTPVIGSRELRANRVHPDECPRVDPEEFERTPELTEPGDVVVSTEGRSTKAVAVVHGGAAVLAPLVILRARSEWMDPRFFAACLESNWNTKYSVGATLPRPHVKDLEVPLLPLDKQTALADVLQRTIDQQLAAEDTANLAAEVRQQTINGIVAGALDVTL